MTRLRQGSGGQAHPRQGFGGQGRLRLVAIAAVVIASVVGYRWWSSPERQIRRVLATIAEDLSHDEPVTGLAAVAGAASLQQRFTNDVVIDAGPPFPPIEGRDATIAAAARLRVATPTLSVEFADASVTMDASGAQATVDCTVTATGIDRAGQSNVDGRELTLVLRLVDVQWMVARATAQRVMEPVT